MPSLITDKKGKVIAYNDLLNKAWNGKLDRVSQILGKKLFSELFEALTAKGTATAYLSKDENTYQVLANSIEETFYVIYFLGCTKSDLEASQANEAYLKEKDKAKKSEKIAEKLRQEIKKHKLTQKQLKSTQSYARSVIDSLVNMVASFDNDLCVSDVNKTILDTSGYAKEELVGRHISDFIDDVYDIEKLKDSFLREDKFVGKVVLKKKDGERVLLLISVSRLLSEKNEKLGFVCSMREVTDIEMWQEKLAFVEERYTNLFENASDLIQGVGIDGKLIYANKAWYKCLGYSKSEMKKLRMIDLIREDQKEAYQKSFKKILKGDKIDHETWNLVSKSGENIIIESSSDLNSIEGEAYSIRSIMRDITYTRKAERFAQRQAAKIEAIFEGSRILFWTVNKKTALTSFNTQYANTIFELYGKYPELHKDESEDKKKFAPDDYHTWWDDKYQQVYDTGKNVSFQTETKSPAGKIYFREIYLNPIWENDQKIVISEIAGMAIDVTEKKIAERKIVEQTSKISTIFNATPHMIWSIDRNEKLTSFNDSFVSKMNDRFGVKMKLGQKLDILAANQSDDVREEWQNSLKYVWEGNSLQFEMSYADNFKNEHIEDLFIAPILDENGKVSELAGLSQTITFKKSAEKKLRDQTAKISAIFDSTAMLIWTIDTKFRIISFNKIFADNYFSLKGVDVSIGNNFIDLMQDNLKDNTHQHLKEFFAKAFQGERQQFEGVLYNREGEKMWMETFFNPIYSENNEIKEITCMSYEITDKKEIEERMRETIREKEVLLQEVHHRVKNNLQVISSILNLQSSYVKDENSLKILRESQNRIKSMSFIHESLYHTGNFSNIEFSQYIYSLTTNLIHSYSLESASIHLESDFEKTHLSLDQAIPCGLIVNEIISNALKYAFLPSEKGKIYMSIKDIDGRIELRIGDNGIGLPKDFDYENSDSLGLQLIYTLVEQLSATIEVDTESGTKYFITFEKQ